MITGIGGAGGGLLATGGFRKPTTSGSAGFPGLRGVPARVRALAALALLMPALLYAVTGAAVTDAREALRAVGHEEGPTVATMADVRLALADMDAEVAAVLLTGRESGWLCDPGQDSSCVREPPRHRYDIRREDAQRAVLQASRLAGGDPVRLRTVQAVLDGLHRYEQHVQAAMRDGARTRHAYGPLPPGALREYRAAHEVMAKDLMPKAGNLALDWTAELDTVYEGERSEIGAGRAGVLALGALAVAVLVLLQLYLGVRFRRVLNLGLAGATLATLALTAAGASLLATERDHLRAAKEGGADPALALARAQADARTLHADRSRSLFDPGRADLYGQAYRERSRTVLAGPGLPSGKRLLDHYAGYPGNAGAAAARAQVDPEWPQLPHPLFREHEQALDGRIGHHRYVTGRAVRDGERALAAWGWIRPLSLLAIAALVIGGVWPRLAEYR
ncbi:hypothetical protein [Spirillospora sp. NPDC029432]|uniref:hypothetical protein n=1 Tax=Spirillospora sp. NPDC029432 TaxID=3154599 RepID=UPI003453CCD9